MSELPAVSGKDAIRLFERTGYEVVRIKGSHHIMKKAAVPMLLTVPVHKNQSLKRGTFRGLLRAAGISKEQAIDLIRQL